VLLGVFKRYSNYTIYWYFCPWRIGVFY